MAAIQGLTTLGTRQSPAIFSPLTVVPLLDDSARSVAAESPIRAERNSLSGDKMNSNCRQGQFPSMVAMLLTMLAVIVLLTGASVRAQAQTPTVIYNFPGTGGDVCQPQGLLVQGRDGYMYGTGGCSSNGGVYKI